MLYPLHRQESHVDLNKINETSLYSPVHIPWMYAYLIVNTRMLLLFIDWLRQSCSNHIQQDKRLTNRFQHKMAA